MGNIVINCRLPAIETESAFWDFLEILFEELRCEMFYAKVKVDFMTLNQYQYLFFIPYWQRPKEVEYAAIVKDWKDIGVGHRSKNVLS